MCRAAEAHNAHALTARLLPSKIPRPMRKGKRTAGVSASRGECGVGNSSLLDLPPQMPYTPHVFSSTLHFITNTRMQACLHACEHTWIHTQTRHLLKMLAAADLNRCTAPRCFRAAASTSSNCSTICPPARHVSPLPSPTSFSRAQTLSRARASFPFP